MLSLSHLGTTKNTKNSFRAKQLVNAQLQRSLDAAKREETLVRGSALKAEALSRKLAFIRVRVEGGAEEGDNCGDDGG